jgi:hypothetical protein
MGHLAHNRRPGARAHLRLVRGQIGARHRKIEGRQTLRFVFDMKQLFRLLAVFGAQAAPFVGFVALPVKG